MEKKQYKKYLLGYHNNEPIYLSPPSWDCGWYWGFGYLGNNNCHYHLDGLGKSNLHDNIVEHFGDTLRILKSQIWEFAELVYTIYLLKTTAEVLGRGGSHLSSNPCSAIIKNPEEVTRINEVVLPACFERMYKILEKGANKDLLLSSFKSLLIQGNTQNTYQFLVDNEMTPEDIKGEPGITSLDHTLIHTKYWHELHNKSKKANER